jgi:hypothetical protein
MQSFVMRAVIVVPVLMLSSFAHAETVPQSGDTKEHKGPPPICQGEDNPFN